MTEIRVAIFEDNKALRNSLQQLIDSAGDLLCTGSFADAGQVVRSIQLSKPDVVMMDINMPGLSGIEAVQVIREKFPHVQILMQTVFEDNDKIFAAICAGASGYILKKTPPAHMQVGQPVTNDTLGCVKVGICSDHKIPEPAMNSLDYLIERKIPGFLVEGNSYKSIASGCFISIDTVSTHVRHIYEKLHVHSKTEAVAKAIRQKLL